MGKSCYIYAGRKSSGAISYFSMVTVASGCVPVTLWDTTVGGNTEALTAAVTEFCACPVKSVCLYRPYCIEDSLRCLFYHLRSIPKVSKVITFYLKRPLEENLLKCTFQWLNGWRKVKQSHWAFTALSLQPFRCGSSDAVMLWGVIPKQNVSNSTEQIEGLSIVQGAAVCYYGNVGPEMEQGRTWQKSGKS